MAEPFIGTDIAAGAVSEVLFNRKGSGGQVYNEADTMGRQLTDQIDHLRKAMQPGIMSNMERTAMAILGEKSASGKEYTLKDEGMAWLGVRTATLNLGQSLVYKSYGFKDMKAKSAMILSRVAGSRKDITDSALESAFDSMMQARVKAYTDMIRLIEGARKLNMPEAKIVKSLRGAKVSRADISALMRGRIPRWKMSRQFAKAALQRAVASAASVEEAREARQDIAKRRRMIVRLSRSQ
jgi:hypothetical protein